MVTKSKGTKVDIRINLKFIVLNEAKKYNSVLFNQQKTSKTILINISFVSYAKLNKFDE